MVYRCVRIESKRSVTRSQLDLGYRTSQDRIDLVLTHICMNKLSSRFSPRHVEAVSPASLREWVLLQAVGAKMMLHDQGIQGRAGRFYAM